MLYVRVFFHENLHFVVVVLDYRQVYHKSWYSGHKLAFPSLWLVPVQHWQDHATLVTHPWLQGFLTLGQLGQERQVCLQNTLYTLSPTLERLPQAEPWYKLQQTVKDVPYLHRGSNYGWDYYLFFKEVNDIPYKAYTALFSVMHRRVEQSTEGTVKVTLQPAFHYAMLQCLCRKGRSEERR